MALKFIPSSGKTISSGNRACLLLYKFLIFGYATFEKSLPQIFPLFHFCSILFFIIKRKKDLILSAKVIYNKCDRSRYCVALRHQGGSPRWLHVLSAILFIRKSNSRHRKNSIWRLAANLD